MLAVIDTGAEMSIGNTALRDLLLHKGRGRFWTTEAIGVTGAHIQLPMAWIDELQVGPIRLQNVPVAFADIPPFELFGLARQPALMLGTDILETFRRVSLDFRARKVRFEVRQCRRDGFNLSSTPSICTPAFPRRRWPVFARIDLTLGFRNNPTGPLVEFNAARRWLVAALGRKLPLAGPSGNGQLPLHWRVTTVGGKLPLDLSRDQHLRRLLQPFVSPLRIHI